MKQIILIGGAPATGKTTLAKYFSKKYSSPWISTDFIRSWMKGIVSQDDYPQLFNFTNTTPEEHYKKYSVDQIIEQEIARDKEVFKGVKEFILKNNDWDIFFIEGISLHPDLISQLNSKKYQIIPFFMIDLNQKRIKEIVFSRGLWDDARNYSDWVKEIECDYLLKTNQQLLLKCKEQNLPFFEISSNRNQTIAEISAYLDKFL